jgi:predicted phosphodiesterase
MKVVVTSDFHETLPPDVPRCDLLLLAGDCLPASSRPSVFLAPGELPYLARFRDWLERQPAESIVGVAGNHDWIAKTDPEIVRSLPWIYLENETAVVDGVRIFGSPLSMPFNNWAYMAPEHELAEVWASIPDDTEVLMVHGPAASILDATRSGTLTGSRTLRDRLKELRDLQLLVTGHIHEAYGTTEFAQPREGRGPIPWVRCVNASFMNEQYRPVNPPIEIEL